MTMKMTTPLSIENQNHPRASAGVNMFNKIVVSLSNLVGVLPKIFGNLRCHIEKQINFLTGSTVSDPNQWEGQIGLTVAVTASFTIFAVIVGLVVFITYFGKELTIPEPRQTRPDVSAEKQLEARVGSEDRVLISEWSRLKSVPIMGTIPFEESSVLKNIREGVDVEVNDRDTQISGVLQEVDSLCCLCCILKEEEKSRLLSGIFARSAVRDRIHSPMKEMFKNLEITGANISSKGQGKFKVNLLTNICSGEPQDVAGTSLIIKCDMVCENCCGCRSRTRDQEEINSATSGFPARPSGSVPVVEAGGQLDKSATPISISNFTLDSVRCEESLKVLEALKPIGIIHTSITVPTDKGEEKVSEKGRQFSVCYYIL